MGLKYPDRWLDYSSIGAQVDGTPFVPLKVPLKKEFFKNRQKDKFTPADVVEQLPNLGLVIDLTFTNKYYDPGEFRSQNVDHKKIYTKGKEVPQRSLVDKFIRIVDTFLRDDRNSDKLIGVHCTHGLNRTGYFVCAYMILAQGRHPRDTINVFNNARSHQMERDNYIDSLLTLNAARPTDDEPSVFESRGPRDNHQRNGGRHSHEQHRSGRYGYAEGSGNWRRDRSPIERSDSKDRQRWQHRENRHRCDDGNNVPANGERFRQHGMRRHRSNQYRWSRDDRQA